jgi:hypothetical protein
MDLIIPGNIDWKELKAQKEWLFDMAAKGSEEAEGLINFLDYIQDSAYDQGHPVEWSINSVDVDA